MSKPLQFSYTNLSAHEQCPEKMRHIYILKDVKVSYATSQDGIDHHKVLEQRLRYRQPLPQEIAKAEPYVASLEKAGPVEVELSLAVDRALQPSGFWTGYLRGKYDVVVRWPEQRRAFIGDWKSGKIYEKADQLEIGAMLLIANDPGIDSVIAANLWLQKPGPGIPYHFARRQLEPLWVKWSRRMSVIEQADPAMEWEKRDGPLCAYCPVVECQHNRSAS